MARTRGKKPSDYTERGYVGLHIKMETRQRLNMAKAHVQARRNEFITQDEFINLVLDRFDPNAIAIAEAEAQ